MSNPPPGVSAQAWPGMIGDFARDPPAFLLRLQREHGDVVGYGVREDQSVQISHPEDIRDVLVTNAASFHKGPVLQTMREVLGDGLLTCEELTHTRQRRMLQPAFHRERINAHAAVMVQQAMALCDSWEAQDRVDILAEMMRLTLIIVCRTLFATEVDTDAEAISQAVTSAMYFVPYLLLPESARATQLSPEIVANYRQALARLDALVFHIIEQRQRDGRDRGDLLGEFVAARDVADDGGAMSRQQLRDEVLTMFMAGHETTGTLLGWTWYALSRHAGVADELTAELDAVLGGRAPTPHDVPQLKYLGWVLQEVLRLWPPAWTIGRQVRKPYRVRDYELPVGTTVLVSPYVTQRDARWFERPEQFEPRRWETVELPRFAFFPFGGGPRGCIGEGFARMEATLVLATLAQRFRLHFENSAPLRYRALITLRPEGATWVRLERRRPLAVGA